MKIRLALALGAALAAGGCADYYGPGPGPGPGPYAYDAFYDGYYGPFYDGYWGTGGVFYYSRGPRHRYVPDRGGHFFHDHPGRPGNWQSVRGPGNFRGGPGFHGGPGRGRGGRH